MGHGSVGQMGRNSGWVLWAMGSDLLLIFSNISLVMGRSMLTHDPLPFTAYVFILCICTNSLKDRIYILYLSRYTSTYPESGNSM